MSIALPSRPATAPAAHGERTRALLVHPILPTLLRLAWPNMLVMLAQASTGLIETWWVRPSRHRRARRHGARLSGRDARPDAVGRRARRRHLVRHRAGARRRPARRGRQPGAARPRDQHRARPRRLGPRPRLPGKASTGRSAAKAARSPRLSAIPMWCSAAASFSGS